MEKLRLNDGTELENSSAILSGDLFLYLNGVTFGGAFMMLSESRKTKKITYTQNNGEKITYEGYTKLKALRDEEDGLVTAVLRKGER
jgi:hypothetical protein